MRTTLFSVILASLLFAAPAAADTILVDGAAAGGPGCGDPGTECKTVQEGVNEAVDGDTVQIAAGTYEEQIDIAKSITVVGAGIGQTIILSPPAASMADKFDFTSTLVEHPIVFIHDTTSVDISDLTVDGDNRGGVPCDGFYAIVYLRAGGTVDFVRGTGITSTPFSGCQTGRDIVNYNFDNLPRTWSITRSQVDDFQKGGIEVRGNNLTSTIEANTVLGAGPQTDIAQNGIVVRNQAVVRDNTVQDLLCNQASCGSNILTQAFSAAVFLGAGSAGAEVDGNTITNSDVAISNGGNAPGDVGTKLIHDNTLTNNRYAGVFSYDGTLTLDRNQISGSDTGIFAESFEAGATDYVAVINGASNNVINNDLGVRVYENVPGATDPVIDLNFNRIFGNTVGASSNSSGSADLQWNWWGCNEGPTEPGCDSVNGTIDFNPWLVLTLDASPASIQANQTSNLTGAVFTDSNDNTQSTLFPDGIPIDFGTSFGSVTPTSDPTSSAQSESVFDPQGQTGNATVSATLDNETVNRTVAVAPVDTDGDGVPDATDNCPAVAGPSSNNGCPLPPDTDGDGTPDPSDNCPNDFGPPSNQGCPVPTVDDTDGDGLIDSADTCPNDPGPPSNNGCPLPPDTDGDGVPNASDNCPNEAGPPSNNGCPATPPSGPCSNRITGLPGPDVLLGTSGSDLIRGGAGADQISGLLGRDCLYGNRGKDVIRGGRFGDKIFGNQGVDSLLGGRGSDVIRGGDRNDVLNGGLGADNIRGGSGRDRFRGGGGRDVLISRGLIRDFVRCGKGRDRVVADFHDVVAADCEQVLRRRVSA